MKITEEELILKCSPLEIIYEDNHLIALNKRSGDIVQGDKTGDPPLSEILKVHLKGTHKKLGNVFCGVIHRIDRPVTGVVIFAKTSKALLRMNQLVHDRQIQKRYWAVVKKKPEKESANLVHYLYRDEKKNKTFATSAINDGFLKAELSYNLIASSQSYHLLDVNLITGRHHQIRCQLAAIGSPIRGDLKYGFPRSNADGSISLHARSISFIHPVSLQTITITAKPPKGKIWEAFMATLRTENSEEGVEQETEDRQTEKKDEKNERMKKNAT